MLHTHLDCLHTSPNSALHSWSSVVRCRRCHFCWSGSSLVVIMHSHRFLLSFIRVLFCHVLFVTIHRRLSWLAFAVFHCRCHLPSFVSSALHHRHSISSLALVIRSRHSLSSCILVICRCHSFQSMSLTRFTHAFHSRVLLIRFIHSFRSFVSLIRFAHLFHSLVSLARFDHVFP